MLKLKNRVCLCTLNENKKKIRVTFQFDSVSWYFGFSLAAWQRNTGKSLNSVERINFLNEYFMFCERKKKFALCFLMLLIVQFNISLFKKFLELKSNKEREYFFISKFCIHFKRQATPKNRQQTQQTLNKQAKNKLCDIMCRNGKTTIYSFL